ncbi:neprilysin-2-like [Coccinella septempunctata]|uniref:neprilysin-2-like n=1 Tax=Coccinella septempunctata TaxID=41139 RepID=UPI001D0806F2|nr:neprilysin-2-like [Coccinella septempunctata]
MGKKSEEKSDLKERKNLYEKLWMPRSKLEKRLILLAVVFVTIFLVVLLLYIILRKPEICTSSTCLESSMNLLNQIDAGLDPCRDFYKFSCGNFLKNTNLEREHFRTAPDIMREEIQSRIKNMLEQADLSDEPLGQAKKFYRACMNESALETDGLKWMKQIFRRMGGWPILEGDNWNEQEFDWQQAVHKLRRMGVNFEFFIDVSVERDKKDPTKYVLQLSDPYKTHNQPIDADIQRTYLRYMEEVAVYFGSSLVNARIEQKDVLEFTKKLAEISNNGMRNNMTNLYNLYVLSELIYDFRSINWYEYINGILSPGAKFGYDDQILVPDPFYLRELEHLMLNTSKRVLANFVAWHTLQYFIKFMPSDLVNKAHEYMESLTAVSRRPRWQMCVESVKEKMGPVISSAYIEQYFDEETRRDVTDMVHNIKDQYKEILSGLDWIDDVSRKVILEKLLDSAVDIVSYEDLSSLNQLCTSFGEVKIYEDNLLLSVMNLDQFGLDAEFRKLSRRVRTNWLEDPDFVTGLNIALSPFDNILVVPVGILNSIYYEKDRPKYLNYGALGSVIGNKVWQIFAATKHKEMGGEAKSWWTPVTLLNYEDRLKCLGRLFGRTTTPDDHKHNATQASEEDLMHLAGVKASYEAYKHWLERNGREPNLPGVELPPEQLFWVYFARPFCAKYTNYLDSVEKVRVNGIVSNIEEFVEDFSCGSGDNMNFEKKCDIF